MVFKANRGAALDISKKRGSKTSVTGCTPTALKEKGHQIQHSSGENIKNPNAVHKLSEGVNSDSGIGSPDFLISESLCRGKRKQNMTITDSMNDSNGPLVDSCHLQNSSKSKSPVYDKLDPTLFQQDSDGNSDPEITFNFSRLKVYPKNLAPLPSDVSSFASALGACDDNADCENNFNVAGGLTTSTPEKKFFSSSRDKFHDMEITLYESPEKVSPIKKYCVSPSSFSSDSCYWEELEISPDNGAIVIHNSPLKEVEESVKKSKKTYNLKSVNTSLCKSNKTYHSSDQFRKHLFKEKKHPKRNCASEKKSRSRAEVKLDKWASFMNDHFKEINDTDLCIE